MKNVTHPWDTEISKFIIFHCAFIYVFFHFHFFFNYFILFAKDQFFIVLFSQMFIFANVWILLLVCVNIYIVKTKVDVVRDFNTR